MKIFVIIKHYRGIAAQIKDSGKMEICSQAKKFKFTKADQNNEQISNLDFLDTTAVKHPLLEAVTLGKQIPRDEIRKAPVLQIDVLEGSAIPSNIELKINACGLMGSLRGKNDGCTIIGSMPYNPNSSETQNDYMISLPQSGIGKRHMIIKYSIEDKNYYLCDLGDGSGTFVRLDIPIILKHGYIISFGESHMAVQFCQNPDNPRDNIKIQLKFLDGPKTDQTFTFQNTTGIVKVGRMSKCDIRFEDNSLSRVQFCIVYFEGNWIIKDGDGTKPSTNGTWLFADELFKIYDSMIFKAGQTLFKAQLLPPTTTPPTPTGNKYV